MALTLQFTIGAPCGGGNHFTVTATPTPGTARVMVTSRPEILAVVTQEDFETCARVILKMLVTQLPGRTPAQLKTAIEGKTINMDVS